MSNQGLIKHTAQPSAQGRLVASTSVLAIRGAPAAAPAGAGVGADTHLARSAAGGLFPITHGLEEESPNPPVLGMTEGQGDKGHTRKDGSFLSPLLRLASSHLSAWTKERQCAQSQGRELCSDSAR